MGDNNQNIVCMSRFALHFTILQMQSQFYDAKQNQKYLFILQSNSAMHPAHLGLNAKYAKLVQISNVQSKMENFTFSDKCLLNIMT